MTLSIKNWFPLLAMSKNTDLGNKQLLLEHDVVKHMVAEHVDDREERQVIGFFDKGSNQR